MPEAILATEAVSKYFGGLRAVESVSLHVQAGSFHSIIGPNGAGKTTLFNLLSGAMRPDAGRIFFEGRDITALPPHRRSRLGIGRSFQITNIFPTLTALENVRLAVQSRGPDSFNIVANYTSKRRYLERAAEILALVGLGGKELAPAILLPHGDQRKLEIAIVLGTNPRVLLLDEPTAGISREEVPAIMDVISRVQASGSTTIMLVEHKMDIVMKYSDVITVMHQGGILAEGTPQAIAANRAVQSAYLGERSEQS